MNEVKRISIKKTRDVFPVSKLEQLEEHHEAIFNVYGEEKKYNVRFVKNDSSGFFCLFEEKEKDVKKDSDFYIFEFSDLFGTFSEPEKTIEKILKTTEEFNRFKKIADEKNEQLKKTYYPKINNVYGMDEYADMYVIHFDLEDRVENTVRCELNIDKVDEHLYTDVKSAMDEIKNFRSYVGWEKDIIRQVLQHKKIRLQFLFAEDFIREYLQ